MKKQRTLAGIQTLAATSKCEYYMTNTFVKLPTASVEIDHIREMYIDLNFTRFEFKKWEARNALVDKQNKTKYLYTGQGYDANKFDLVENGWTQDDCQICFRTIGDYENEYTDSSGYFNGGDWVCKNCYEQILSSKNIEETLKTFPQF